MDNLFHVWEGGMTQWHVSLSSISVPFSLSVYLFPPFPLSFPPKLSGSLDKSCTWSSLCYEEWEGPVLWLGRHGRISTLRGDGPLKASLVQGSCGVDGRTAGRSSKRWDSGPWVVVQTSGQLPEDTGSHLRRMFFGPVKSSQEAFKS